MTPITLMLVAFAAMLAATNWRSGLFLCVLTGLLQDPLRKIAPNQPVYYVVLIGVVFGAAWLGALGSRVRLGPNAIEGWRRYMGVPFALFIGLVGAQAMHSYLRFGSATLTMIGLMVWLAPLPAVVLAYQFAVRGGLPRIRRWMLFYCVAAMTSLAGVYLQYTGVTWPLLGEVGPGLVIYGGTEAGGVLKAYSGFFRSSEIAAWHTSAMAAFVFMLFTTKRLTLSRMALALALIAVLATLGALTGRRKMLVEIVVFVSIYVCQVAWFQRGAMRMAIGALVVCLMGYTAVVGLMDPDVVNRRSADRSQEVSASGDRFRGYAVRGQSVFEDIPNRVANLGVAPVGWAVNQFGWFGAGLGTGTQQGSGREGALVVNSGAAEGGIGKITMELGVPGLVVIFWLGFAFVRYLLRVLEFTSRTSMMHARIAFGLLAFLAAKGASFSVAAQAFSDLFVLLMMGWAVGFVLAMPVLAARAKAAAVRPAPVFQPARPQVRFR